MSRDQRDQKAASRHHITLSTGFTLPRVSRWRGAGDNARIVKVKWFDALRLLCMTITKIEKWRKTKMIWYFEVALYYSWETRMKIRILPFCVCKLRHLWPFLTLPICTFRVIKEKKQIISLYISVVVFLCIQYSGHKQYFKQHKGKKCFLNVRKKIQRCWEGYVLWH